MIVFICKKLSRPILILGMFSLLYCYTMGAHLALHSPNTVTFPNSPGPCLYYSALCVVRVRVTTAFAMRVDQIGQSQHFHDSMHHSLVFIHNRRHHPGESDPKRWPLSFVSMPTCLDVTHKIKSRDCAIVEPFLFCTIAL
jgi:hypothetical protein